MFICCDCGKKFSEDELAHALVCWEAYYGVSSMFPNRDYGEIAICPFCGSEELEECYDDDEE